MNGEEQYETDRIADGLLPTREGLKAAQTLLIQLQAMLGDGLRLDDIAINYAAKDINVNFTPEEYLAFAMDSVTKVRRILPENSKISADCWRTYAWGWDNPWRHTE
jgi:hypothetical protein